MGKPGDGPPPDTCARRQPGLACTSPLPCQPVAVAAGAPVTGPRGACASRTESDLARPASLASDDARGSDNRGGSHRRCQRARSTKSWIPTGHRNLPAHPDRITADEKPSHHQVPEVARSGRTTPGSPPLINRPINGRLRPTLLGGDDRRARQGRLRVDGSVRIMAGLPGRRYTLHTIRIDDIRDGS